MRLAEVIRKAGRVFLCGNGGSAANAIHIANDLVACGVKAHALPAEIATLTAFANDHGYDSAFAMQVEVLASPGDLLIALSGSGRSPNILRALEAAKRKGVTTYAIVGGYHAEEPPACQAADMAVKIGDDMQGAEEWQLVLGHEAMKELRRA